MYLLIENKKFVKAFRKYLKTRWIEAGEVEWPVEVLVRGEKLDFKYRDHELKGEYRGVREFHVKPDLLVLYRVDEEHKTITIINMGSHSELFG